MAVMRNCAMALLCLPALALAEPRCSMAYRPTPNETAFAPVGAALVVADRHCINSYLVVKGDRDDGPVGTPAGSYPEILRKGGMRFYSLRSAEGREASSCLLCDPLEALMIRDSDPAVLCVISRLGVSSCAGEPGGFEVRRREAVRDNLCAPSLRYHGREGQVLRFAVDDCKSQTGAALTYDLGLGSTIRFLSERYEILSADNEGLSYRRLEPVREPKKGAARPRPGL
ncbi:MAG: hypothetical protein K6A65_05410 [Succinivibrionaceae bacterium]|nr:hypothetical protein [Succinivibrionaceae bacterium]